MIPSWPDVPDTQRASAGYRLRWEDITQDGRLRFSAVVASIGPTIWAEMLAHDATQAALVAEGTRAVFTRLAVDAGDARFSLGEKVTTRGAYQLAHERGADGAVSRLYLNMWTTIEAAGRRAPGLFAEHVVTRPFGPREQRRVTSLPGGAVPPAVYRAPRFDALLDAPDGAKWLESDARADATTIAFGVVHTDVNQHVNSMVYPAAFEDAVLRRLASLGRPTTLLARRLEIAFRKPFFAGQSARIALRLFESGGAVGAVGAFAGAGEADEARPHVFVRMRFER